MNTFMFIYSGAVKDVNSIKMYEATKYANDASFLQSLFLAICISLILYTSFLIMFYFFEVRKLIPGNFKYLSRPFSSLTLFLATPETVSYRIVIVVCLSIDFLVCMYLTNTYTTVISKVYLFFIDIISELF